MAEGLTPWQEAIYRRIVAGERVVASARQAGKHQFLVEVGADLEESLERWDVIGPPEAAQRLRRQAREAAAERQKLRDELPRR